MNKNEKNAYKDCLMDGYKELFRCTQSAKPEEYTRFVAMRGEKYDSLDPDYSCRLMIVGRA